MKTQLLTMMLLCITLFSNAQQITINDNKFYVGDNQIWLNGVNTPWDLWCDFGNPNFDYDWWDEEFASYEENHINLARVWIHCNGDISPNIDTTGYVSGVDDIFWEHMDYLFDMSKKYGVYVMPALLSFDITKDTYDNYQSWRNWLQDTTNIRSYIDNVLIPMLQRYEDEPYLLGWEICNEPEWMFENDEHGPQSFEDVQTMHAMFAAAIHENSERYVTTGSAAPKWNSPIYDSWGDNEGNMFADSALAACVDNENAYLDFYQYHWYAWQTEWMDSPWTKTTEYYEVDDRPVIVGECEGEDVCDDFTCLTIAEEYEAAYQNGFDGVCGWKTDTAVYNNIIIATNSFYNDHPDLVYPEGSRPTTVTGVSLSDTSITIEGNETYQLTATIEPSDATVPDVLWESASPTIASVSDEGVVTGITPGTTTITVSTLVGDKTAYCTVEVTSSGSYGNCTNPVPVSLPYTYSGAGPGCYITSGDITVVQSYNSDLVELNGTDVTNEWYTDIPSSLDGVYWIYYDADANGYLGIQGSGGETSETVELTTSVTGEGSVSPSSGSYTLNSTLELTATPSSGYVFSGWSGDTTATDNPITITMDADKSITATFVETESDSAYYTLSVLIDGGGAVLVTPSNDTYLNGTDVTLIASADSGYVFDSWSGDVSGTSDTITLTMDANKSVTANFSDTTDTSCDFGTPLSTALPSVNASYNYVHVIGDGPDLSNVTNFTINWDLDNEGLWQLSISTNDGDPNWWNDLLSYQNNTFSETQPSITLSDTDFDGLDGSYYVAVDDGNFVMEDQSGTYILYFSNSSEAPCTLSTKSTTGVSSSDQNSGIRVYPNPANNEVYFSGIETVNRVVIHSVSGQKMLDQDLYGQSEIVLSVVQFETGWYIISFYNNDGSIHTQLLLVE